MEVTILETLILWMEILLLKKLIKQTIKKLKNKEALGNDITTNEKMN